MASAPAINPPSAGPTLPNPRPVAVIRADLDNAHRRFKAMEAVVRDDRLALEEKQKEWNDVQAARQEAKREGKTLMASLIGALKPGPKPELDPAALARAAAFHSMHYYIKQLDDELATYTKTEQAAALRSAVFEAASVDLSAPIPDVDPFAESIEVDTAQARAVALQRAAGITTATPK